MQGTEEQNLLILHLEQDNVRKPRDANILPTAIGARKASWVFSCRGHAQLNLSNKRIAQTVRMSIVLSSRFAHIAIK